MKTDRVGPWSPWPRNQWRGTNFFPLTLKDQVCGLKHLCRLLLGTYALKKRSSGMVESPLATRKLRSYNLPNDAVSSSSGDDHLLSHPEPPSPLISSSLFISRLRVQDHRADCAGRADVHAAWLGGRRRRWRRASLTSTSLARSTLAALSEAERSLSVVTGKRPRSAT